MDLQRLELNAYTVQAGAAHGLNLDEPTGYESWTWNGRPAVRETAEAQPQLSYDLRSTVERKVRHPLTRGVT